MKVMTRTIKLLGKIMTSNYRPKTQMYFLSTVDCFSNEVDFRRFDTFIKYLRCLVLDTVREIKSTESREYWLINNLLQNGSFFSKVQAHFSRTKPFPGIVMPELFPHSNSSNQSLHSEYKNSNQGATKLLVPKFPVESLPTYCTSFMSPPLLAKEETNAEA